MIIIIANFILALVPKKGTYFRDTDFYCTIRIK